MKTSKIKKVVTVKPHTNSHGTTFYHNLEMENGDKINIGKKSNQQEGWELTYEIVEEGQQEFNKAKAVRPDGPPPAAPRTTKSTHFKADPLKQASIEKQVALKEAINFHQVAGFKSDESDMRKAEIVMTAKYFYEQYLK